MVERKGFQLTTMCLGAIKAFKTLLVCGAGNLSKPYGFQNLHVIAHIANELHRYTMQNPDNEDSPDEFTLLLLQAMKQRPKASQTRLWHQNSNAEEMISAKSYKIG